ncbi:MAG: M28 family peptidase [Gemmatimonas sp.]|nr:M28 family peptidase [Gemmatimonas sp.]
MHSRHCRPLSQLIQLATALFACAPANTAAQAVPRATAASIEADDLRLRIGLLAADSLLGRDTGAPGLRTAADYLAAEMSRLGLEPAGDDGTYLQRVPLERRSTAATVTGSTPAGDLSLGPGEILPVSGLGGLPVSSREGGSGPLVFAGSIADPDVGANELTLEDLEGAVVIVRFNLPADADPATAQPRLPIASLFGPESPASAVLLVAEEAEEDFWEFATEVSRTGAVALSDPSGVGPSGPPFFLISIPVTEDLLGEGLATARLPRTELGSLQFELEETVEQIDGWNVAAVLPGREAERAEEYVALGAHYDHIGVGTPVAGDSIYNGADDNASGTSALVEVAEAMASLPDEDRPARSVLFVWNTAEEAGLLGSEYFTDQPTVERTAIVAHLNLDMVGRNHPDSLFVVGSRRISSELGDAVEEVNDRQASPFVLDYTYDSPNHPEQLYCRSDHYNYARYGIPVVFMSTGLHDDYHATSDHTELIDFEKAARVSRFVSDITRTLADLPERPVVDQDVPPLGTPCQG